MLDRLRGSLASSLSKVGAGAAKVLPWPTGWTLVGFGIALVSASYYSRGGYSGSVLGGAFVLLSSLLDVVDGAVARATGKTSKRGAFLDSTLDRLSEVAIYLGILVGGYTDAWLVLLALSLSLLVSYARAKADSLGVNLAGVGVGERSERLLVLIVTSLLGAVVFGVLIVGILALATLVERVYRVARTLGPK